MNLTDRELVALYVITGEADALLSGRHLVTANRATAKLAAEIKRRALPLAERDHFASADRFAAKMLGVRCCSNKRARELHDERERARSIAKGKCPCSGEAIDPGPHISSCSWSDPNYGDDEPW